MEIQVKHLRKYKFHACAQSCLTLRPNGLFIACQAHLSMEFPRQEILEWVAIPYSRGSCQPRDRTWVSCIGRQVLYY